MKSGTPDPLGELDPSEIADSLEEITERHLESERDRIRDIESRAKPLYELVETAEFSVKRRIDRNYSYSVGSFNPKMGGGNSVQRSGMSFDTRFEVTATEKYSSRFGVVRFLEFSGRADVNAGDIIKVQMPIYKKNIVGNQMAGSSSFPVMAYTSRDPTDVEESIHISKRSTYETFSANYSKYQNRSKS